MSSAEPQLVMVDGREALAAVLVMPKRNNAGEVVGVYLEAQANGMSHMEAAYVLRSVADQWQPQETELSRLQQSEQALSRKIDRVRALTDQWAAVPTPRILDALDGAL